MNQQPSHDAEDVTGRCRRVLAYHEFSSQPSKDVYQLQAEIFCRQIHALRSVATHHKLELQVTFDDAHYSQLEIAAPILEQAGLRGLFFVPAAWPGSRPTTADWNDLQNLIRMDHRIGSHGLTHRLLTSCSQTELREELSRSKTILEDKLGVEIYCISMPGGRWSRGILDACLESGYVEVHISDPGPLPSRALAKFQADRKIYHRLVVRRTMSEDLLSGYVTGDRFTSACLHTEFILKQKLKTLIGDTAYQTIWHQLLRHPS